MKRLLWLFLFIPVLLNGQTETNNTKELNRAVLNNSRATNSINQTILKVNNLWDSIIDLRSAINSIGAYED